MENGRKEESNFSVPLIVSVSFFLLILYYRQPIFWVLPYQGKINRYYTWKIQIYWSFGLNCTIAKLFGGD